MHHHIVESPGGSEYGRSRVCEDLQAWQGSPEEALSFVDQLPVMGVTRTRSQ